MNQVLSELREEFKNPIIRSATFDNYGRFYITMNNGKIIEMVDGKICFDGKYIEVDEATFYNICMHCIKRVNEFL